MATTTMSSAEHSQVARDFLTASDEEFARGDNFQGAEKLWGAASHAVMAVAQEKGWRHDTHRTLKNAAIHLATEREDPLIRAHFSVAEKFHVYFYHRGMEDWELNADRPLVRDFVHRVLTSE